MGAGKTTVGRRAAKILGRPFVDADEAFIPRFGHTVAEMFAALEAEVSGRTTRFDIRPDAARRSVLLIGGEMAGGRNFNVVPDHASFTIDRRTNPDEDFDAERQRLFDIVERARSLGVKCDVEVMQEGRSAATDAHGALGEAVASSVRAVTRRQPSFELCPGVTFFSG